MADLKRPKLPDRTPVKLVLTLPPELARALGDYQTIYNERYAANDRCPNLLSICSRPSLLATASLRKRAMLEPGLNWVMAEDGVPPSGL